MMARYLVKKQVSSEGLIILNNIEDNDITDKVGLNSSTGGTVNNNSRCYYSKFIQLNEGDTLTVWSLAQNIGGYLFQYSQPAASSGNFYSSVSMGAYEEYNGGYIRQAVVTRDCYATFQFTTNWDTAKSNQGSFSATGPDILITQQYCVAKLGMRFVIHKEV